MTKHKHPTYKHAEKHEKQEKKEKESEDYKKKADEYMETAQRIQAEFENYKKRIEKRYEEDVKFSCSAIIKQLLPVIDSLDDAMKHMQKREEKEEVEGIVKLKEQFMKILKENGLQEIETKGKKFDPEVHECVLTGKEDEKEDEIILEEMRKGYLIHNKVLRPAMVKVNKKE